MSRQSGTARIPNFSLSRIQAGRIPSTSLSALWWSQRVQSSSQQLCRGDLPVAFQQNNSSRGYETPGHEKDHILQTGSQAYERFQLLFRSVIIFRCRPGLPAIMKKSQQRRVSGVMTVIASGKKENYIRLIRSAVFMRFRHWVRKTHWNA